MYLTLLTNPLLTRSRYINEVGLCDRTRDRPPIAVLEILGCKKARRDCTVSDCSNHLPLSEFIVLSLPRLVSSFSHSFDRMFRSLGERTLLRLVSSRRLRQGGSIHCLSSDAGEHRLLVLNAGSSSLKFKVFEGRRDGGLTMKLSGMAEKIGEEESVLKNKDVDGKKTERRGRLADHKEALRASFDVMGLDPQDFMAVGHRVINGGDRISKAVRITPEVKAIIQDMIPLAPLHNAKNLVGIESAEAVFGEDKPQVAVFDTAFHQTMPPSSYMYAVPHKEIYEDLKVRRYGFHGSSYAYLVDRTAKLLGRDKTSLNMILLHLGAGASMACIEGGKCIDTTMGLTPLEGLVMGTRCGDIDPGAVLFLVEKFGFKETDNILNRRSGLLGLCNSLDMRDVQQLIDNKDPQACLALDIYCHRIQKYLGAYLVELRNKLDVIVFSAGVGENSVITRQRACEGLEAFGIELDPDRNNSKPHEGSIHRDTSKVKILVVPTDEELHIAEQTLEIVGATNTA